MIGYDAQGNYHYRDGGVSVKKTPREELKELRAFKAQQEAKNKTLTPEKATITKPVPTQKTFEVKQDKRREEKKTQEPVKPIEFDSKRDHSQILNMWKKQGLIK